MTPEKKTPETATPEEASPKKMPADTMQSPSDDPEVLGRRVAILRRHVDHLLGQLYHQIELIKLHRDRAEVLDGQLEELRDCPKQLDEALKLISNLKEDIAGRKEVELELRRHQELVDREDSDKDRHIERLEGMLNKVWDTPVRRTWRTVRRALGMKIGDGEGAGGKPPR